MGEDFRADRGGERVILSETRGNLGGGEWEGEKGALKFMPQSTTTTGTVRAATTPSPRKRTLAPSKKVMAFARTDESAGGSVPVDSAMCHTSCDTSTGAPDEPSPVRNSVTPTQSAVKKTVLAPPALSPAAALVAISNAKEMRPGAPAAHGTLSPLAAATLSAAIASDAPSAPLFPIRGEGAGATASDAAIAADAGSGATQSSFGAPPPPPPTTALPSNSSHTGEMSHSATSCLAAPAAPASVPAEREMRYREPSCARPSPTAGAHASETAPPGCGASTIATALASAADQKIRQHDEDGPTSAVTRSVRSGDGSTAEIGTRCTSRKVVRSCNERVCD